MEYLIEPDMHVIRFPLHNGIVGLLAIPKRLSIADHMVLTDLVALLGRICEMETDVVEKEKRDE